jgi:very-short-patch-repair endonuclease
MNIDAIIDNCIKNKINLRSASINDGYNPSYYSNLINRKYKHKKYKIKEIERNYFENNANRIYPEIVDLIKRGMSTTDISKKIGRSNPTILKIVRYKAENDILNLLEKNNNYSKSKGFRQSLGHARGKTYDEIYGSKADEMKQKRSEWLKVNNIRRFATKISKPQAMLYNIVKNTFPQAEIEHEVKAYNNKSIWLDIAIPDLKIDIEYDGIYWHTKNKNTISLSDESRDEFLHSNGWKVFRIRSMKNLTEEELKVEFNKLKLI